MCTLQRPFLVTWLQDLYYPALANYNGHTGGVYSSLQQCASSDRFYDNHLKLARIANAVTPLLALAFLQYWPSVITAPKPT